VYRIMREFDIRFLESRPSHLNNVAALPCEKQQTDAACRIVDNINNASTGTCQNHPLITGKTIINSVNWTLQTRHTVGRGDMDTYFVMYRWSKTLYTTNIATFAFHKVVRQHYSGEVSKFTIFLCETFSWFCTSKIIKTIGSFFAEL